MGIEKKPAAALPTTSPISAYPAAPTPELREWWGDVRRMLNDDLSRLDSKTSFTHRTGDMISSSSKEVPDGWLKCDGRAVSRAAYKDLFDLYSSQSFPFGAGDGTRTFNLPNMTTSTLIWLVKT